MPAAITTAPAIEMATKRLRCESCFDIKMFSPSAFCSLFDWLAESFLSAY
jgi:hypothetical protein